MLADELDKHNIPRNKVVVLCCDLEAHNKTIEGIKFISVNFWESISRHQLISYNSSQLVKDRFQGWEVGEFDLTYTMRSVGEYMREQKERKELVLFNYGIEGLVEQYQSDKEESNR